MEGRFHEIPQLLVENLLFFAYLRSQKVGFCEGARSLISFFLFVQQISFTSSSFKHFFSWEKETSKKSSQQAAREQEKNLYNGGKNEKSIYEGAKLVANEKRLLDRSLFEVRFNQVLRCARILLRIRQQ